MRAIAAGLILALCASALSAEESPLQALVTADETRGWEGVGRINLGGAGFCTGALIDTDLVLTAAHCLFDRTTGERFPVEKMEFLAGWRNGRAAAYRGVKRAIPHPDYVYEGPDKLDRVAYDLAILELDQPIRLPSIKPFATDRDPDDGEAVGVVSYALDRSEAPSLQQTCHVLGRQTGILVLSCNVDFGASGSPIFAMRDGVPKIVSVVSAKAEMDAQHVALGTEMSQPLSELEAVVRSTQVSGTFAKSPGAQTAMTSAGGAKFVKP